MKKILSLFICLISIRAIAQPSIQWQKSYGGSYVSYTINAEAVTGDGGFILAGQLNARHAELVRLNASGGLVWKKTYGGSSTESFHSVQQTSDGGYIAVGTTNSNDGDVSGLHNTTTGQGTDIWVVKTNAYGDITWQKCIGGTGGEEGNYIQQTSDGGYIITGDGNLDFFTAAIDGDIPGNKGNNDLYVIKLTDTGGITWFKNFGGAAWDIGNCIKQTTDGGYIVAGQSSSSTDDVTANNGGYDDWIIKLTGSGDITWQKTFGGSGDDYANSIQLTTDGGYIVAGQSKSNNGDATGNKGNFDYWIIKLDATGGLTWQKNFGGSGEDDARSIEQTTDGGYIVAGSSWSIDGDITDHHGSTVYPDAWIVKLASDGSLTWKKSFGANLTDYGSDIKENNGNYVIAGIYMDYPVTGHTSYWLAFLNSDGNLVSQVNNNASGGDEYATGVAQTATGGYIMAGYSNSTDGDITNPHGNYDFWLVNTDAVGNIIWEKTFGGSSDDIALCAQSTKDGGFIAAGQTSSTDGDITVVHGNADAWIVKLNASGAIQWQKSYGGSGGDYINSIQQTTDGGYIAVGTTSSSDGDVTANHGGVDYWVIKLDASGNITWQKTYGGSSYDFPYVIKQTTDGGYIVAGSILSNDGDVTVNHGNYDTWVLKLNASGTVQWQKSYGGSLEEEAKDIIQTNDGNYIIAGYTLSSDGDVTANKGNYDVWVIKVDASGNIIWQKTYGGSDADYAYAVQQSNDGNYLFGGYSYSSNGDLTSNYGSADYWVFQTDTQGNLLWQKNYGGSGTDYARSMQLTNDGGLVLFGDTNSKDNDVTVNKGGYDYWLVKLGTGALPLTLLNFSAQLQNKNISLQWQTANEINTDQFIIERSVNSRDFTDVGTVDATTKNSGITNYSFVDDISNIATNSPTLYYRLKMTDKDGKFTYSKIASVNIKNAVASIKIFPNPATSVLNIKLPLTNTSNIRIKVLDAAGRDVLKKTIIVKTELSSLNIENLPRGIYYVSIEQNGQVQKASFIKQ